MADETRAPLVLLGVGAAAGFVIAAIGLLAPAPAPSSDFAARVGGTVISHDDYDRVLAALATDKKGPLTQKDRAWALERLIDEELLIARGLDLGLARTDRQTRAAIVRAMMTSITAETAAAEHSDDDLRAYHAENLGRFTESARYRVRAYRAGSAADARALTEALRTGTPPGQSPLATVPDALLPAPQLATYLGPSAVEAARALEPGAVGAPIARGGGYLIVHLVDRQDAVVRPFAEVRGQVAAAYRRDADDAALRDYLDWLKSETEIERGVPSAVER